MRTNVTLNQRKRVSAVPGSPAVTDLLPDKLEATLVPDQGYHQVGPADHCSDMFVLSVTVAFATKLEQVRTVLYSSLSREVFPDISETRIFFPAVDPQHYETVS